VIPAYTKHRTAGGWTPAALFTGANGLWLETDLTTLFQDSAGTTPVTTTTNPVGLWQDKSGNNNHVSQATSTNRPTYSTTGHPNVLFNGTSQWLQNALQILNADGACEMWVAGEVSSSSTGSMIDVSTRNGSSQTSILRVESVSSSWEGYVTINGVSAQALDSANWSANTDTVIGCIDSGDVGGSFTSEVVVNNNTPVSVSRTWAAISSNANPTTLIGAVNYSATATPLLSHYLNGSIYAIVAINRALTTAERANLKTYLAAKYGGVL